MNFSSKLVKTECRSVLAIQKCSVANYRYLNFLILQFSHSHTQCMIHMIYLTSSILNYFYNLQTRSYILKIKLNFLKQYYDIYPLTGQRPEEVILRIKYNSYQMA